MDTLNWLRLEGNPLEPVEGPFIESSSLCDLYLGNCNITQLSPQFFAKLGALERVNLSGNPLQIIHSGVFSSLRNLDTLSLNNCNITYIYSDAFKGLVKLQILEIEGNNFANFVEWSLVLRPLDKLSYLHITKSGIVDLNKDMFRSNCYKMRALTLAENDLSDINLSSFDDCISNLIYLDLSYCNIKGPIAEDMFLNTRELLSLKLAGNRIFNTHLSVAISSLTKLRSLSLSDSGLITLPKDTFYKMTSLKTLDISKNPWNTAFIEVLLSPLTSLENLNLSYSKFKIIKNTTFSKLSKLKTLILSGNKIINVEKGSFENLKSLEVLELNNCGLSNLNHTIFYDEDVPLNLIELKLSENPLQMPVNGSLLSRKLRNLINLDISGCNLTFVSPDFFIQTPNIKRLFLNNNKLSTYDDHTLDFMSILGSIVLLDLSFNKMDFILPNQLTHNNQLTSLRLYGNPWSCDCEIVSMWDWIISDGWLDDAVKPNINETIKLMCNYDLESFPHEQPQTNTMTWKKFALYSKCPRKTNADTSILSRVIRKSNNYQEEISRTEKEMDTISLIRDACFMLLIISIVFLLAIIILVICHGCKVLYNFFVTEPQNYEIHLEEEEDELL